VKALVITAVGVPALQNPETGAVEVETPLAIPQAGVIDREALQAAFVPPLAPRQFQEVEEPAAGKIGLAGLAVPESQIV
jgi:hypothetical protein